MARQAGVDPGAIPPLWWSVPLGRLDLLLEGAISAGPRLGEIVVSAGPRLGESMLGAWLLCVRMKSSLLDRLCAPLLVAGFGRWSTMSYSPCTEAPSVAGSPTT